MPRGKATDPELKAQVMAALLAGVTVSEAARRYKLDKSLVSRLKNGIEPEKLQQVATESGVRIDQLLADSLQSHLRLQKAITETCADADYIRGQKASDLAQLLEVSQAHTIRLLEAACAADEGAEQ